MLIIYFLLHDIKNRSKTVSYHLL